jgi:hypothetical protein
MPVFFDLRGLSLAAEADLRRCRGAYAGVFLSLVPFSVCVAGQGLGQAALIFLRLYDQVRHLGWTTITVQRHKGQVG